MKRLLALCTFFCLLHFDSRAQNVYPVAPQSAQLDTIWHIIIKDPYRGMENIRSPEVAGWLKQEQKISDKFSGRTDYVYNHILLYSEIDSKHIFREGQYYCSYRVDGGINGDLDITPSLYFQEKIDDTPNLLFDPNNLDKHANISISGVTISSDNKTLALILSKNGSDWETIRFLDMKTKKLLTDTINYVKYSPVSWFENGLFYIKYDVKNTSESFSGIITGRALYYHKIGTKQSEDKLVYKPEDKDNEMSFEVTPRHKYLVVYHDIINSGVTYHSVSLAELNDSLTFTLKYFISTRKSGSYFNIIGEWGDKLLLVQTNNYEPTGAIYKYSLNGIGQPEKFIKEYQQKLEYSKIISNGTKILSTYFKDSSSIAVIRDSSGNMITRWEIPSGDRFSYFSGSMNDSILVFGFHSFVSPGTIYKINTNTYAMAFLSKTNVHFSIDDLVTETVYYNSKDSTLIPMYLTHKKGIKLNGNNPTILYGYGGFNVSMEPFFDAANILFFKCGGILATPCIRGGGDFPGWHEKGSRLNKQNSFDDFIAAAQYLISKEYTNPQKLAIMGSSNGGLLVGAVMLQRPDLFKVVVSQSGVFDMMRYHLYNVGYIYKTEYGNINDSLDFRNLLKYSPVQNVKQGINYPATLLVASDNDDRVSPFHSFKFLAELQTNGDGKNPYVLYYEQKSGHSGSRSIETEIKKKAYVYAFIFKYLGMDRSLNFLNADN